MSRNKKLILSLAVLILAVAIVTPAVITFLNRNSFGVSAADTLPQPIYGSDWQTTEVVSTESSSSSQFASLSVGADGTVHIAWDDYTDYDGSGTDADVFYKRYEPGVGWTTTEIVSTESTGISYCPSLDVETDGTVHIAWEDFTDYSGSGADKDIFYKRYEPGVGWTTTEVVSTESTGNSYYPSLDVETNGTVHIAWEDHTDYAGSGTDEDIFYKRYEPGVGWTTSEVVSTESTEQSRDTSLGVSAHGTVHIAWVDNTEIGGSGDDDDVHYKRYEPGVGWTTTEVVSIDTWTSNAPSLDVGTDETLHIAWEAYSDYGDSGDDSDVFYRRYELGVGWTAVEVVSTESSSSSHDVSLCVCTDGTVHVAWPDLTDHGDSGADRDVFYKRYEPGIGWTTSEVVSTESTESSNYPSLSVGADGIVHVAWGDFTDYGGSGTDRDIFYKRNVFAVVEPYDLCELMETSRLAHLRMLYGSEKSDAYTEIQSVEGYAEVRGVLESQGYVFLDYNISMVKGSVLNQSFRGLIYSHWSNLTSDGTAALLVAAMMHDGVNFMLGIYTNILPVELTQSGPYIIVNAMPYSFIKLHFYDALNDHIAVWGYSYQESNTDPDWFWNIYSWWRTYTRQHYTWYYYQPWRYIWHYTYWKHWQYT